MNNFKYNSLNMRVVEFIPSNATILDVGCSTGQLGRFLIDKKKPKKIVGIDNDTNALKEAEKYYDVIHVLDIDDLKKLPLGKDTFECIVLADILEHTKNPKLVLNKLKNYLSPGGIFVISVPNFSFFLVRLKVLFGKFQYQSEGILDETHLHFFTPNTIKDLVIEAGLNVISLRGYINTRKSLMFADYFAKYYPSMFAYQLLLVAQ